jgi:hypothetical protein
MTTDYKVKVTEDELEEGVMDGVMTFTCPKCGSDVLAEPDAQSTCCQVCNTSIRIINPYF